jgi:putative nucleotidyltransferase-like protein
MQPAQADLPAVIRLLRAMPGSGEQVADALDGVDWNSFAVDAGRHGLSGALNGLAAEGLAIPKSVSARIRSDSLAIAASGLRSKALLLSALDAMARRGVEPILLKGYGLAKRLYPDPLMRPTSDVDLLAHSDQYGDAEQALLDIGLRPMRLEPPEEAKKDHHAPNFWGHEKWFGGDGGLVELHWRPLSGFGTAIGVASAFARRRQGELEGRSVYYLSAEDELVYLAAHAAKHLLGRLSWLYDIKLLIRKESAIDFEQVLRVAFASEMNGPVYFALEAVRRALATDIPERVLQRMGAWRWHRALAPRLFSEAQLARSPYADRKYATYLLRLLLASNVKTQALATWGLIDQARRKGLNHHLPHLIQRLRQTHRHEQCG